MSTQSTLSFIVKRSRTESDHEDTDTVSQVSGLKKPRLGGMTATSARGAGGPCTADPIAIKAPDFDLSSGVTEASGTVIAKDPDLDLLHFEPFLKSPVRKLLFDYLLGEFPWYRVCPLILALT